MIKIKKIIFVMFLVAGSSTSLLGQSLEEILTRIVKDQDNPHEYMENYLQPLATSIGISMGNGLYNFGPVVQFPGFKLGFGYSAVLIPDDAKSFQDSNGERAPTVFGPEDGEIPGFNTSQFPLWIIQGDIGLFGNLEANLRYSRSDDSMLGIVNIVGGGLRYGLTDIFIPVNVPMDISVQAAYHYLLAKDYLASGSFNMNLNTEVSIPSTPLSATASIAFNNSNLIVNTNQLKDINGMGVGSVSVIGENGVRYHVGANLQIWKVCLSSDYSFGTYRSWYLSMSFGI